MRDGQVKIPVGSSSSFILFFSQFCNSTIVTQNSVLMKCTTLPLFVLLLATLLLTSIHGDAVTLTVNFSAPTGKVASQKLYGTVDTNLVPSVNNGPALMSLMAGYAFVLGEFFLAIFTCYIYVLLFILKKHPS
jgi:hypothetical protein